MINKKEYIFSLAAIFILSIYPIYMGVNAVMEYIAFGAINTANFPKYMIPYTPICIALIIVTATLPLIIKLFKKKSLLVASSFGALIFIVTELWFEKMTVFEGTTLTSVEVRQMLSCVATPEVSKAIGNPFLENYNSAFKIHFYIISILIIFLVIHLVHSFIKMPKEEKRQKRKPLVAQLISTMLFVGLCVYACFTAFYRTGDIVISPISAVLMALFFIVFGVSAGVYLGSLLYGKKKLFSRIIPSIVAVLMTIIMYIGELVLMSGELFRFGTGFIFESIGFCPLSIVDFIVIMFSGIITYVILLLIKKK